MMVSPYTNFFCQTLFLSVDMHMRCQIISGIFRNFEFFMLNSLGRISVEFILENISNVPEQELVVQLLMPRISQQIIDKKYFRLIECILGCFNHKLIIPILHLLIPKLIEICKSRDGFFMARALILSSKFEDVQFEIVKAVSKDLQSFISFNNGAMIVKLVIKGFLLCEYAYSKNASKPLIKTNNNVITHRYKKEKMSTRPLEALYAKIISCIDIWDNKKVNEILTSTLKTCKLFNSTLYNSLLLSNDNFTNRFLTLKVADKFIKLLVSNLNKSEYFKLCYCFRKYYDSYVNINDKVMNVLQYIIDNGDPRAFMTQVQPRVGISNSNEELIPQKRSPEFPLGNQNIYKQQFGAFYNSAPVLFSIANHPFNSILGYQVLI